MKLLRFKQAKRATLVLFCLCIALTVFSQLPISAVQNQVNNELQTSANLPDKLGFQMVYENKSAAMYTDVKGEFKGTFALRNKVDGTVWYSSPPDYSSDTISFNTNELLSLLNLTYYDKDENILKSASSKPDCVDNSGLSVQSINKGLKFLFYFSQIKITVPLLIQLEDDGSLIARIVVEEIIEQGSARIFTVSMLPYFCSASEYDSGFIFVPDGSGAVMMLNNKKTAYASYDRPVYGGDASEIPDSSPETAERIYIPVFGMQRSESAVLSIIEEGAAQSSVTAITAGVESSFNVVANRFSLRSVSSYSMVDSWQKKNFKVYQKTPPTIPAVSNRYVFLSGEQANLAGMVGTYREYLQKTIPAKKQPSPAVYVDLVGVVSAKKPVLGFPMETQIAASTYSETVDTLRNLKELGVSDLNLRYLEWDSRSAARKIVNSAKPSSVLGGKNNFNELLVFCRENQIGFFPNADLIHFGKTDWAFQEYFVAARNMNNEINKYYSYKLNLFSKNTDLPIRHLLGLKKLQKTVPAFLNSYEKLGLSSLSLTAIGSLVASDYSSNDAAPWKTAEEYKKFVEDAAKKNELLLSEPNLPLALNATHLLNLPSGSGFDMMDYTVPFYQMVVSGLVSYTGRAINLSAEPEIEFLRAIEIGGGLHYSLLYRGGSEIVKDTPYASWIGAEASSWLETIAKHYKEMKDVYNKLGSNRLISYEVVQSGVIKSDFEGGGTLLVNEGDSPSVVYGYTIEPRSYMVLGGDGH